MGNKELRKWKWERGIKHDGNKKERVGRKREWEWKQEKEGKERKREKKWKKEEKKEGVRGVEENGRWKQISWLYTMREH